MAAGFLERPKSDKNPRSAVKGTDIFASSELGKQIIDFTKSFAGDRFYKLTEAAKLKGKGKQIQTPYGNMAGGAASERGLMTLFGWYWEPLLHDIAFLEEMRDSIPLLLGAYQKFTDLVMTGLSITAEDPADQKVWDDALLKNPLVDFYEIVRASVFEIASIANSYRIPVWGKDDKKQFSLLNLKPVRVTAMRKLRDDDLSVEGYVQLMRRPAEFIMGKEPPSPVTWLAEEVCCGMGYSASWYAYGRPLIASLPFVVRMKLQMERDIAEMMHQHVPRIVVTYTPEEQMTVEAVKTQVDEVSTSIGKLKTTDNLVVTPDTVIDYKGPLGKALDASGPQNHIEEQFFAVLPLMQGVLSRDLKIDPYQSQQGWQMTCSLIAYLRNRAEVMFTPMIRKIMNERNLKGLPKWGWTDLDVQTAQTTAGTQEVQTNTAVQQRNAGFVEQDHAAAHATQGNKGGPVKKAAAPGAIPPPVDPNAQPAGASTGDNHKGPTGKKTPEPDKRPKGKRHGESVETIDDILQEALEKVQNLGNSENPRELTEILSDAAEQLEEAGYSDLAELAKEATHYTNGHATVAE